MTKQEWLRQALDSVWSSPDHEHVSIAFVKALLLACDEVEYDLEQTEQFNCIQLPTETDGEIDLRSEVRINSKRRKHESR
jgi:hypothetical protein